MKDLTTALISVEDRRRDKWSSESEALFLKAAAAVAGQVHWDSDAGEDWARIVDKSDDLVAYVYALAPLVICLEHGSLASALPTDAAVVEVQDFDRPELTADPSAMSALFGDEVFAGELRSESFSAQDLWFWTV